MEKLSPEEISDREERYQERRQENIRFLDELATELNLEIVPAAPIENEKGRLVHSSLLSAEEEKQLSYTRESNNYSFYLRGSTEDGEEIKAVVFVSGNERDVFAADIFAPGFYNGHSANHDWNKEELRANLEMALGIKN